MSSTNYGSQAVRYIDGITYKPKKEYDGKGKNGGPGGCGDLYKMCQKRWKDDEDISKCVIINSTPSFVMPNYDFDAVRDICNADGVTKEAQPDCFKMTGETTYCTVKHSKEDETPIGGEVSIHKTVTDLGVLNT